MPPEILHASSSLLRHVAEPAARSIVLGCCAGAALGALRVRSVSAKLFVWRGVLAGALAMPLLGLLAPSIRVPVPAPSFAKHAPRSVVRENVVHENAASESATTLKVAAVAVSAHADGPIARPKYSVAVRSDRQNAPVRAPREIAWAVVVASAYALIALFFLARLFIGMRLGKRLEGAAKPIQDVQPLAIAAATARAAGLRVAPRLAESEMLSVPVTLGLRNAVILFPAEWRDWDPGEFEAVVVHEISHVARRDALVQRLALIHRAFFWFSPLAWWLDRQLADLSEQASDEAALASGADRTRYAETLLGFFATLEAAPQRVWWQGVSMAKAGQAEKRVDRILAWRGAMSNRLKRSLVVGLVAVAAPIVVLTASVHPSVNNFQEPVINPGQAESPTPPQVPPAPAQPRPSANPIIAPGPAPQAPSIAPPAPPTPGASLASIAPEAPIALIGPEGQLLTLGALAGDSEQLNQAYKAVREAQEALRKVNQAMAAAKARVAESETEAHLNALNRAMAAYDRALATYKSNLAQYHALLAEARELQESAQTSGGISGGVYGGVSGGVGGTVREHSGPRFVIVTKDSKEVTMSGSDEDVDHALSLKSKIPGDFIWFERDEKSYIIRDQATVDRAKKLWEPEEELGKKQEELGKQQEALGKQQEALGEKMEQVRVKIPDMTADMQALMAKMKELSANGGTQEEIGELQSQIGELQSRVGEIQSDAGRKQSEIGRQQSELGRKQGELGRQQGELGRQQGELSRQASRQMRELLDEAVAHGLAQPE